MIKIRRPLKLERAVWTVEVKAWPVRYTEEENPLEDTMANDDDIIIVEEEDPEER